MGLHRTGWGEIEGSLWRGEVAVALEVAVAQFIRQSRWPAGHADLRNQGIRASPSVVLNIAEGWSRPGAAGRNQLRIARASAGEVLAVLDLVELSGGPAAQQELRRIGAMLRRLEQRR